MDPQMPDSGNQPIAAGAANLGYITPQYSYGPPTQQQWQFQQQQHFNQWNAERNAQNGPRSGQPVSGPDSVCSTADSRCTAAVETPSMTVRAPCYSQLRARYPEINMTYLNPFYWLKRFIQINREIAAAIPAITEDDLESLRKFSDHLQSVASKRKKKNPPYVQPPLTEADDVPVN
jgi:hypothetical protein